MSMNIDDDDAPPDLVDVSAMPADQAASISIEEEPTARVPITLVTGMAEKFMEEREEFKKKNPLKTNHMD